MKFSHNGRDIDIFILSHRTTDRELYWRNIKNVADWSESHNFRGVLLFEGNDTFISPWVAAQEVLKRTKHISPLVAVNPIYMHPFTAAKMVSSLSQVFNRKIFVNMITGTALNYLESMDDTLDHDERYSRLQEYIQIMQSLVASTTPLTYKGKYYKTRDLQLLPGIGNGLQPVFLISGQSEAAKRVAEDTGALATQMLLPKNSCTAHTAQAVNFGLLCRESEESAWLAANRLFPNSEENQLIQEYSMTNTDSAWKKRMQLASQISEDKSQGYWMSPFRNFQADGPYLVGSYEQVAERIQQIVESGIYTFILDINPNEEEYNHIVEAFRLALNMLKERKDR